MNNVVYVLPVPSTSFGGVTLHIRPVLQHALKFEYEDAEYEMRPGEIVSDEVVHFRTTYLHANRASYVDAYDRLTESDDDPNLDAVLAVCRRNDAGDDYRIYRIYFDDDSYYEFFCRSFHVRLAGEVVASGPDRA